MGFLEASLTFNSRTKIKQGCFCMNNHENIQDNRRNESIRGYNIEKKGRIVGGKNVFWRKPERTEQIIRSNAALEEERRIVTVLIWTVKDSRKLFYLSKDRRELGQNDERAQKSRLAVCLSFGLGSLRAVMPLRGLTLGRLLEQRFEPEKLLDRKIGREDVKPESQI